MPVIQVNTVEEFDNYLTNHDSGKKFVVVDFSATWCGPCKKFYPDYVIMSDDSKYASILFLKVDVEELPEITDRYQISAMPTFMFFEIPNLESEWQPLIGTNRKVLEEKLSNMINPISSNIMITDDF